MSTTEIQKKILRLYADWHKAGKSERLSSEEAAGQLGIDRHDVNNNLTKLEAMGFIGVQRIPSLNYTAFITSKGLEEAGA